VLNSWWKFLWQNHCSCSPNFKATKFGTRRQTWHESHCTHASVVKGVCARRSLSVCEYPSSIVSWWMCFDGIQNVSLRFQRSSRENNKNNFSKERENERAHEKRERKNKRILKERVLLLLCVLLLLLLHFVCLRPSSVYNEAIQQRERERREKKERKKKEKRSKKEEKKEEKTKKQKKSNWH